MMKGLRLGGAAVVFGPPRRRATPAGSHPLAYDSSNVFARILRREIPTQFLHEDEQCVAFRDIAPQAPLHLLVIPKRALRSLADARADDAALLGHLLLTGHALAQKHGHPDARVVVNTGAGAGQTVFHLHVHVLAGRPLAWPPG
jgi:histidine triad (HIT) family protein